jgi:hypothetical protein
MQRLLTRPVEIGSSLTSQRLIRLSFEFFDEMTPFRDQETSFSFDEKKHKWKSRDTVPLCWWQFIKRIFAGRAVCPQQEWAGQWSHTSGRRSTPGGVPCSNHLGRQTQPTGKMTIGQGSIYKSENYPPLSPSENYIPPPLYMRQFFTPNLTFLIIFLPLLHNFILLTKILPFLFPLSSFIVHIFSLFNATFS